MNLTPVGRPLKMARREAPSPGSLQTPETIKSMLSVEDFKNRQNRGEVLVHYNQGFTF